MRNGAYYEEKLSASKLLKCYEIASPRIRQYLAAEIRFVISNIKGADMVLELGCGYGRVLKAVCPFVSLIVGNDVSRASLKLARSYVKPSVNFRLVQADASNLSFRSSVFDAVFCIQNGISAFGVNQKRLVIESLRVTKHKGLILFSSYSPKIWQERLDWFRQQSQLGLVGKINKDETRDGTIICEDGFTATTITGDQMAELFGELGFDASIVEVDCSSIFCKVIKQKNI
jgi:ubiquinone/menaquinone biosynthesis C-methylase UbiE